MRFMAWFVTVGIVLAGCHTIPPAVADAPSALPAPPVVSISFPLTNRGGTAIVVKEGLLLTAKHVVPVDNGPTKMMRVGDTLTGYEVLANGAGNGQSIPVGKGWLDVSWEDWSNDWCLLRIERPELAAVPPTPIDWDGREAENERVYLIGYPGKSPRTQPRVIEARVCAAKDPEGPPTDDFVFVVTDEDAVYPGVSGGLVARLVDGSEDTPPTFEVVGMFQGSYQNRGGAVDVFGQFARRPPRELMNLLK